MIRSLISLVTILVLSTLSISCSNSTPTQPTPTGTLTINSPVGGEVFKVGDQIAISWTCSGCGGFPTGDYVGAFAYDGANASLIITNANFSDTKNWTVGSTLQNTLLLPGFYTIVVEDSAGVFAIQSRIFQIISP